MKRDDFYNIISESPIINGEIEVNFIGIIDDVEFRVCSCGTEKPQYYISLQYVEDNKDEDVPDSDTEKYYDNIYLALDDFKIKGKSISQQIENITKIEQMDYSD